MIKLKTSNVFVNFKNESMNGIYYNLSFLFLFLPYNLS